MDQMVPLFQIGRRGSLSWVVTMQLRFLRMWLATVICTGVAAFAAALTDSPNGDLPNRLPEILPLLGGEGRGGLGEQTWVTL